MSHEIKNPYMSYPIGQLIHHRLLSFLIHKVNLLPPNQFFKTESAAATKRSNSTLSLTFVSTATLGAVIQ